MSGEGTLLQPTLSEPAGLERPADVSAEGPSEDDDTVGDNFIKVVVVGALGQGNVDLLFKADLQATGDELRRRVAALASVSLSEVHLVHNAVEIAAGKLKEDEGLGAAFVARFLQLSMLRQVPREELRECQDSAEMSLCAICFEDLAPLGGAVLLPCKCRVTYCSRCWDRALNAKYDQTRRAECPSCRTSMRVDFDAEARRLCFNKLEESDSEMRNRLYEQARPLQITLLQQYGVGVAPGGSVRPLKPRPGPLCVCGSRMSLATVRARVLAYVARCAGMTEETARENDRCNRVVDRYLSGQRKVPITCDICDEPAQAAANVWTCEAGNDTLLHGLAYDVCERCYAHHVLGPASTASAAASASG